MADGPAALRGDRPHSSAMKAVVFHEHGGPEVLRYEDARTPRPGPGEVRIAVAAVAVNRGPDTEVRRGEFGAGGASMPHIGGVDPTGEVIELAPGVDDVRVGDRVAVYPVIACDRCGSCRSGMGENYCRDSRLFGVHTPGGRAQYACVPAKQLVKLPSGVSYEAAAALGVAYTTTWHGIVTRARTGPVDTVLVIGAGGGCGVAAVQIGKLVGARVLAVTGTRWKQDRLRELGADEAYSYRDPAWAEQVRVATGGRGATVLFDNAGRATLRTSIDCLDHGGRLFCSGATTGPEVTLDIRRLYRRHISLLFYRQGAKADMERLVELVDAGLLTPVIDARLPMSQARRADERVAAGEQFGRVLLVADDGEAELDAGVA